MNITFGKVVCETIQVQFHSSPMSDNNSKMKKYQNGNNNTITTLLTKAAIRFAQRIIHGGHLKVAQILNNSKNDMHLFFQSCLRPAYRKYPDLFTSAILWLELYYVIGHKMYTKKRNVSKGLWSPCSPDLCSCDFHYWKNLKQKV